MFKPQGIIAAMVTPMTEDEQINEMELRRQVNRLISAGVHGLFCLGTNGEFYALSGQEKLAVIEAVLSENRGRLPVYAGTGCITTADTVELSQQAKAREWMRSPSFHPILSLSPSRRFIRTIGRLPKKWIYRSCSTTSLCELGATLITQPWVD